MLKQDQIEVIAEAIWQGEWLRGGTGRLRSIPWRDVNPTDQERYRFVARHVYTELERAGDLSPRQLYDATR